ILEPVRLLLPLRGLALTATPVPGVRVPTHRAAELLDQHFHGPALAAVLRLEVAHLQFTAAPDLLPLVQRPLAERLGARAQRLDGDPRGALVVAVAVSDGHAGGPDGGAALRVLNLRRGGQSASERVAIQVAHADFPS